MSTDVFETRRQPKHPSKLQVRLIRDVEFSANSNTHTISKIDGPEKTGIPTLDLAFKCTYIPRRLALQLTVDTCSPLGTPRHGTAPTLSKGLLEGSTATFTCNDGYALRGLPTMRCTAAGWNLPVQRSRAGELEPFDYLPTCVPAHCDALPMPEDGYITYETASHEHGALLSYKSRATYHCLDNYRISHRTTRTCSVASPGALNWTAEVAPTCKLGCPRGVFDVRPDEFDSDHLVSMDVMRGLEAVTWMLHKLQEVSGVPFIIMHGSLLGAWWNNISLPWDGDIDVSMWHSDIPKLEQWMMDMQGQCGRKTGLPKPDGDFKFACDHQPKDHIEYRLTHLPTGIFADITTLRKTKDTEEANQVIGYCDAHPDCKKSKPDDLTTPFYAMKADYNNIWGGHLYNVDTMEPLQPCMFNGYPMWCPNNIHHALVAEYPTYFKAMAPLYDRALTVGGGGGQHKQNAYFNFETMCWGACVHVCAGASLRGSQCALCSPKFSVLHTALRLSLTLSSYLARLVTRTAKQRRRHQHDLCG